MSTIRTIVSQAIPSGFRNGKQFYLADVNGFDIKKIIIYWDNDEQGWYCKNHPNENLILGFLNNPGNQPLVTNTYLWDYPSDLSVRINLSSLVCTDNICMLYLNSKYAEAVGLTQSAAVVEP